jgi:hypothetical protein
MITSLLEQFESRDNDDNVKTQVIGKQMRTWAKTYTDLNIDVKKTMSLLRKKKSLKDTSEEIQQMYAECLSRDIIKLLQSCFAFYEKKHKFSLQESDKIVIQTLSPSSMINGITLFKDTIGPMEKKYKLFTNRNIRKKPKNDKPKKLGEFNIFIKNQWATRRDELSALCKGEKGSSSVMKILANEWKLKKNTTDTPSSEPRKT